jgi:hypothetical protein
MTQEEFWALYEVATDKADDKLVQFGVRETGVICMAWEVADWSPVRSAAVDMQTRARYHTLAMEQTIAG